MSRTATRAKPQADAANGPLEPADLPPLSASQPCGPSLEYDPEYALLHTRMTPRAEAQYGSFVDTPEAPNWAEVERDCRRLLLRTRDINVLVWLCRARTRQGQAAGLVEGLSMLCAVLQAWPEEVHPQLFIDGERDPLVRANALAALTDPDGLLADVREIVVAANTATRLTVRDVERAYAVLRVPEAENPEAVTQQIGALRTAAKGDVQAPVNLLARAAQLHAAIQAWAALHLGEDAPALQALGRLLNPFGVAAAQPLEESHMAVSAVSASAAAQTQGDEPIGVPRIGEMRTRQDALRSIRAAREWFETHEPSSPVAVLLRQSERMVGKRFSQVVNSIPLELLQMWEAQEGDEAVMGASND